MTHVFWFKNESPDSIVVERIKPGCSCMSARDYKRDLAPGDSTAIEIAFKTDRYRNLVSKKTRITTYNKNTSAGKIDLLKVSAYVLPDNIFKEQVPLLLLPLRLSIDSSSYAESYELVFASDPGSAYIIRVVENPPEFSVSVDIGKGITITPTTGVFDSTWKKSITLSITCDSSYHLTIPVEVRQ